jgi:flagellin-like protein
MMLSSRTESATSPVIAAILLVAVTMVLAMLVLLLCLGFALPAPEPEVPAVFRITSVRHTDENGVMNHESYLVLANAGSTSYKNRYLFVKLYVNGTLAAGNVPTLNADAFINSDHWGVERIGGPGSTGSMTSPLAAWYPDQLIFIDFSHDTFRPGDTLRVDVGDSTTGTILSRDTYPAGSGRDAQWFYYYFLTHRGA